MIRIVALVGIATGFRGQRMCQEAAHERVPGLDVAPEHLEILA